jgi:hypothetical protein
MGFPTPTDGAAVEVGTRLLKVEVVVKEEIVGEIWEDVEEENSVVEGKIVVATSVVSITVLTIPPVRLEVEVETEDTPVDVSDTKPSQLQTQVDVSTPTHCHQRTAQWC